MSTRMSVVDIAVRSSRAFAASEALRLMSEPLKDGESRSLMIRAPYQQEEDMFISEEDMFIYYYYNHRRISRLDLVDMEDFESSEALLDHLRRDHYATTMSACRVTTKPKGWGYTVTGGALVDECRRALELPCTSVSLLAGTGGTTWVGADLVRANDDDYVGPKTSKTPKTPKTFRLFGTRQGQVLALDAGVETAASLAALDLAPWYEGVLVVQVDPLSEELAAWGSAFVEDALRHRATFWDDMKAELMARAWHPSRMVAWCMDTQERHALESDLGESGLALLLPTVESNTHRIGESDLALLPTHRTVHLRPFRRPAHRPRVHTGFVTQLLHACLTWSRVRFSRMLSIVFW